MKYLVSYSGGYGSFWSAKLLVDKYGKENVVGIFVDVGWEDEDLHRFIKETTEVLDIELVIIKAPYKPLELSKMQNVIYNSRMANCSMILKTRLLYAFLLQRQYVVLREKFDMKDLVVQGYEHYGKLSGEDYKMVLGIDWTEAHRMESPTVNWKKKGYDTLFPLVYDLNYNKRDVVKFMKKNGIKKPNLYTLGFSHNNCGGRCIKGGHGHFKLLHDKLPKRFQELVDFENNFNEKRKTKHTILTKTKNGVKRNYPLEELREDIKNAPEQIDMFDIGGCGCFIDDEDNDDE